MLLEYFTLALGGWPHIFGVATASFAHRPPGEGTIVLPPGTHLSYVSLALGSALSNFLYPHVLTGTLAARNRSTVRTGLSTLPAYTLLLGFFGTGPIRGFAITLVVGLVANIFTAVYVSKAIFQYHLTKMDRQAELSI